MTVGIDLGTCFSAIGYINNGHPEIISNPHGSRITPSCVAVSSSEILVGEDAISVKDDLDYFFIEKSKVNMGSNISYITPQGKLKPQDVAYHIINHLLKYAKEYLNTNIESGVITVPAYFTAIQRKLTKESAEKTGITVTRIISEPTAASLVSSGISDGSLILVYDLGGGTFDCSILQMYNGLARVISTFGDTNLGGKDFDQALAAYILPQYESMKMKDQMALLHLTESAKRTLTTRDTAVIHLGSINPSFLPSRITSDEFKSITAHLMAKTKECIFSCLKDAGLEPSEITGVYLVGGSTRMRQVPEMLQSIFSVNPQLLGNPDEAVAIGATIHANDIKDDKGSILLVDVIPLSLSVEIEDGICKKIIRRNSPIPTESEEIFTTAVDNQSEVQIKIYQGENELSKNNLLIGTLVLDNIEPALRGDPKILVKFSIDTNATLHVIAKDINTGSISESKMDYNFDSVESSTDDTAELLSAKLKNNLRLLCRHPKITEEQLALINDAIALGSIEFLQATYDDITKNGISLV
jgi:molecular chaperone DnaK